MLQMQAQHLDELANAAPLRLGLTQDVQKASVLARPALAPAPQRFGMLKGAWPLLQEG